VNKAKLTLKRSAACNFNRFLLAKRKKTLNLLCGRPEKSWKADSA